VTANGLKICVEDEGSGPPVVLIMGIAAQLTLWPEGFVERLVDRGLRVIRLDNRDIGLSEHLDHLGTPDPGPLVAARLRGRVAPAPYTLSDMAQDTLGVLDALDLPRAHLVGASMGGFIAQVCALEAPERVHSLTSIMSSPGTLWSLVGDPRALLTLALARPTTRDEAIAARWRVAQAFNNHGLPLDEATVKRRAALDYDRSFHPEGPARHLAAILGSPERRQALTTLRVPTHVIHGERDPVIPLRGGKAVARAVPGATLQIVPRMGHHLPEAAWDPVVDGISRHVWAVEDQRA